MIRLICYNYSMRKFKPTNFLQRIIHKSLDLIFPLRCFGCQKEGIRLCHHCLDHLPRSFSSGEEKIFSVFDYNSPIIKQAIWSLKYKRGVDLAKTFAPVLNEILLEELFDKMISGPIILIPVPLSPTRRRERGYNQAEELAKEMVAFNPQQFSLKTNLIKKIKDTPTQVSIKSRQERLQNLKGAFALNLQKCSKSDFEEPRSPTSNIFVIIDDVSTTGTTIGEIRQLLEQAGYRQTYGLVLAHG